MIAATEVSHPIFNYPAIFIQSLLSTLGFQEVVSAALALVLQEYWIFAGIWQVPTSWLKSARHIIQTKPPSKGITKRCKCSGMQLLLDYKFYYNVLAIPME